MPGIPGIDMVKLWLKSYIRRNFPVLQERLPGA